MMKKEREVIETLKEAVGEDHFIRVAYDVVDRIKESKTPFYFVEPILQLMEECPEADFGQPGPLTHFLETFYKNGYEERLVQSVKRKPTLHTVWLMNRIMNDPKLVNKDSYLDLLMEIRTRNTIDKAIKDRIALFLGDQ
ncbi:hypothetical protein [Gorillibacterium sp. CAU 1737]|uniref:hypothetical protein n=1 Tax=Gorillibacterium sp. CAU 1737 TaxID=3140362 RepID=UPI003260F691